MTSDGTYGFCLNETHVVVLSVDEIVLVDGVMFGWGRVLSLRVV
jgi:hypothetical protein